MRKIKNYLERFIHSRFVQNISITFSESIITKFFSFFVTLILIRQLGPENYGIYSFILINIYVLSELFDFGMETTAVRFYNKEKNSSNSVFGLYFLTKIGILFFLILLLGFYSKNILLAMHKSELIEYIPFFIVGLIGESLFFINDTFLQAVQKYKLRAFINITRYITLFIYVIILFLKKIVLIKYAVFVFIIPSIFTIFFIPRYITFIKSFFTQKLSKTLLSEITHYQKWMFALATGNGIHGRIDIYMLSFWINLAQIGIYSAAYNLLSIISFLPIVLGKVMLPKMAETNKDELFDLTIRIVKPAMLMSFIAALIIIPLLPFVVPILFGQKYLASIIITQILSLEILAALVIMPFEHSMYCLGRPEQVVFLRYLQIAIIVVLNFLTIPLFGMIWAAINMLIARIIFGISIYLLFLQEKKQRLYENLLAES